ncbi:methylated-DNA--[protein]-cysteine S-methyltransferase [Pelovirga terrestris]|uniref:methylated-DNA--[protein]-cysteine S-methyltransferase n=1 Tax=Pelovirga terrestris TaxID=2771352 RepID=A0A8J6QPS0_9BACT|nr:methylated-DNA--[protein]-cysteine S-methyltransferase [Pelovirga terrestris]MBD1400571.1 methylated-DNA--[protein]-cysteine S-methyltransferase [Pelovirga terrestris]
MLITTETTTTQQLDRSAEPIHIIYGNHPTPFGPALIAFTPRGLCHLDFFDDDGIAALAQLRKNWPQANLCEDHSATTTLTQQVFAPPSQHDSQTLRLHLRGTDFQLKVWLRLLHIPPGQLISYQELAQAIDQPKAVRAVGGAVGRNPICYLIPCHRVVRSDGSIGGYRSGIARKKTLLVSEAAHQEPGTDTPT